jgi:hypothetical protein
MKSRQFIGLLIFLIGGLFVVAFYQGWISLGPNMDDFRRTLRGELRPQPPPYNYPGYYPGSPTAP